MEKTKNNTINKNTLPKQKKNILKRIFKIILYIVILLISINILLYIALSIPYVQQKVLAYAVNKVKEITKTEVQIDGIGLRLFNNISLQGIYVEDLNKDTLVYAKNLEVSLSPMELLKSKLLINSIDLDDFTIKLSQENPDSDFNYQFIIDAFSSDTTATEDTTSSSLKIAIEDITLKNGRIRYDILSEPQTPHEFNSSHIAIDNLQSTINLPSIDMAKLNVTVASLSFAEHSGLLVKQLKGKITSDNFLIRVDNLHLQLTHSLLKIPSAQYNLLTHVFSISAEESTISPSDLTTFMPDLKYLPQDIQIETNISGKLPAVNINELMIKYGEESLLNAEASISDYANYDTAQIDLAISTFMITPQGISDFAHLGDSTYLNPDIIEQLGTIRLGGDVHGKLSDFKLNAESWAQQGSIQIEAQGSTDTTFLNFDIQAKLQTQNFNLGNLLQMPDLGRLSMNIEIDASQSQRKPLSANVKGLLNHLLYAKQNLNNIPFTAYYNEKQIGAWLKADLPLGKIDATVDMTQSKVPHTTLDLNIQQLHLGKFVDLGEWKNPELSLNLNANIDGLDINTMQGNFVLKELKFSHDSLSFYPGTITLDITNNTKQGNLIKLGSSFFDANIFGHYDFATLSDEFSSYMNQFLPSLFPNPYKRRKSSTNNDIQFNALIHNTQQLEKVFDLPFQILDPVTLNGKFNSQGNDLEAIGEIKNIVFGENYVKNTKLNIVHADSALNIKLTSGISSDDKQFHIAYNADIISDTISNYINLKSDDQSGLKIDATLKALAHLESDKKGNLSTYLQFQPSDIDVGKLDLHFMPARITNDKDKTQISNFGFTVGKGRSFSKFLGIDGIISNNDKDTLNINFTNAQLGDLLYAFNIENVSTLINGDIKLVNILAAPEMYTGNLQLNDIMIFGDTLGVMKMYSKWNDEQGAIGFYATLGRGEILSKTSGWVYPEQDSLNLKINLDRLSLNWIEPFMEGLLNKVSGSISTGLTAKGRISSPTVQGWLGVNDTYLGIDYTNVTYHISDTIAITPDKIGFDNLIIQDNDNNTAKVNATVTHHNFDDIKYNLDVTMKNLLVLNTMNRTDSLFYGKLFVNGTANINGTTEGVNINMNIRNGKDSKLNILIPQTLEASEYASIVYINTPVTPNTPAVETVDKTQAFPLKLGVDLNINKDISLKVIINPFTGDAMEINGSGLIKFNYDMQSEAMAAFGNYIISSGTVKLKIQNLLTMLFQIEDGSKVVLNGDPLKTNFDITAYKRVRADLRTLDPSFEVSGASTKVIVDCVLGISGNMDKMNLTYNIRLPDAPDDIQQKVRSLLTTNEQRTRQFAYLLVTGSFYSNGGGTGGNIADGLLTNIASSTVSSALNALFGNMLGSKWQIGTNISSNDGTFSDMDMSVNVSRSFLDDRLTFNTNLGYRTDQSLSTEDALIGDFDVEYALTRAIKLKVFNKTNDQLYKQAPITQGVGIVYTKEAKKFKNLFKIFRKKRKRKAENR